MGIHHVEVNLDVILEKHVGKWHVRVDLQHLNVKKMNTTRSLSAVTKVVPIPNAQALIWPIIL